MRTYNQQNTHDVKKAKKASKQLRELRQNKSSNLDSFELVFGNTALTQTDTYLYKTYNDGFFSYVEEV